MSREWPAWVCLPILLSIHINGGRRDGWNIWTKQWRIQHKQVQRYLSTLIYGVLHFVIPPLDCTKHLPFLIQQTLTGGPSTTLQPSMTHWSKQHWRQVPPVSAKEIIGGLGLDSAFFFFLCHLILLFGDSFLQVLLIFFFFGGGWRGVTRQQNILDFFFAYIFALSLYCLCLLY